MQNKKLRLLCLAAVMAAVYVGLDFLSESASAVFGGSMKISLSGLPVVIVAVCAGPLWGGVTGFIGEFIIQLCLYGLDPTTLIWALAAASRGLVMGWMFLAFKKSTHPLFLTISTVVSSIVVTLLNTGGILIHQTIYGYSSYLATLVQVPTRIASGALTAVLFALILPPILRPLKKYIL